MPVVRPGRPPDPEKHEAILSAAKGLFLKDGYDRVSMDQIAQVSGVSKQTIYRRFPNKEALFGAMIRAKIDEIGHLGSADALIDWPPEQALTEIASRFVALMSSEDNVALHRVLAVSSGGDTTPCRLFYEHGVSSLCAGVEAYFRAASERGLLAIDDPAMASDLFLSMFKGSNFMRRMYGIEPVSADDDARLVKAAVKLFLDGTRVR